MARFVRFKNADHDRDGQIQEAEWAKTLAGIEKFRSGYQTHGVLAIPLNGDNETRSDRIRTLITEGVPESPLSRCS